MKKSKLITLVLITASLASCHKKKHKQDWNQPNVYMRSDPSAGYAQAYGYGGYDGISPWLWYYAFRPYGYYNGTTYVHTGYYSGGINQSANIGHSGFKSSVVRGGFGGHGFSVSS